MYSRQERESNIHRQAVNANMKTIIERGTRSSSDTALDSNLCENWVIICDLGVKTTS
jgi:hypothetical protein